MSNLESLSPLSFSVFFTFFFSCFFPFSISFLILSFFSFFFSCFFPFSISFPILSFFSSFDHPSDEVAKKQRWPQSKLQFEYAGSKNNFDDLEFNLFVAGEL
jgi:hypothetical protein